MHIKVRAVGSVYTQPPETIICENICSLWGAVLQNRFPSHHQNARQNQIKTTKPTPRLFTAISRARPPRKNSGNAPGQGPRPHQGLRQTPVVGEIGHKTLTHWHSRWVGARKGFGLDELRWSRFELGHTKRLASQAWDRLTVDRITYLLIFYSKASLFTHFTSTYLI